MALYSDTLLDHFGNPRNVGDLDPPAVRVEVTNPACGDILRLSVLFKDGRVAQARYKARGCTASIAAGSALTELMLDKTAEELARLGVADVERAVGWLIPESRHAAVLCVDALRALLKAEKTRRTAN